MSDARGAGDEGSQASGRHRASLGDRAARTGGAPGPARASEDVPAGSAFQVLSLVEGLLFVGFVVTFSVGASRPGLALLAVFVVLLAPTVVAYRRLQEWKARGA